MSAAERIGVIDIGADVGVENHRLPAFAERTGQQEQQKQVDSAWRADIEHNAQERSGRPSNVTRTREPSVEDETQGRCTSAA